MSKYYTRNKDEEITDKIAEELVSMKCESAKIDYKVTFQDNTESWMELAKDVYGMANIGGGTIVIGVSDANHEQIGLSEEFHIDSQIWMVKFSKWVDDPVNMIYYEYIKKINNKNRKFLILRIMSCCGRPFIPKISGTYINEHNKQKTAFHGGVLYIREGASTVAASAKQFANIFYNTVKNSSQQQNIPIAAIDMLNKKSQPDPIPETLWTNLFPVKEIPDFIHYANTNLDNAEQIYKRIYEKLSHIDKLNDKIPAFILHEKKIFTFSPFDYDNPLNVCTSSNSEKINTIYWVEEVSKHYNLTKLLNFNLKKLCRKKHFQFDNIKKRYYANPRDNNTVSWKPYGKYSKRMLIRSKRKPDGSIMYHEHFAAVMKFIIYGKNIFLSIEPTRVLTKDYKNPLDQKDNTRVHTKNNSRYHNSTYLYDLKFILHIIAKNKEGIQIGARNSKVIISMEPLLSTVNFGIMEDQRTKKDFFESLKSEPLDFDVIEEENLENEDVISNPLVQEILE